MQFYCLPWDGTKYELSLVEDLGGDGYQLVTYGDNWGLAYLLAKGGWLVNGSNWHEGGLWGILPISSTLASARHNEPALKSLLPVLGAKILKSKHGQELLSNPHFRRRWQAMADLTIPLALEFCWPLLSAQLRSNMLIHFELRPPRPLKMNEPAAEACTDQNHKSNKKKKVMALSKVQSVPLTSFFRVQTKK